jgi:hypothetical protein
LTKIVRRRSPLFFNFFALIQKGLQAAVPGCPQAALLLSLFRMASLRQIDANRRNSQKSTGPRTTAGKAASRLNALRTGIDAESQLIPGEDPAALRALITEYHDHYRPYTPGQRSLVDTLINDEWLLRRFRRIEAELAAFQMEGWYKEPEHPIGKMYDNGSREFARLQNRINSTERSMFRALKMLRELQTEELPEPEPIQAGSAQIGFVPEIPKGPAAPGPETVPPTAAYAPTRAGNSFRISLTNALASPNSMRVLSI